MRAIFFPALFLLLPLFCFSQAKSSIDILGGIEYSHRLLIYSKSDIVESALADLHKGESGKLNWRAGFNYNRRLHKKFYLKTGLRIASVGFKGADESDLRWGSQHDGMGGFDPNPDLVPQVQYAYDYLFLEVPIIGRIEFNEKKLAPFLELGVSPHMYLSKNVRAVANSSEPFGILTGPSNLQFLHLVGSISFGCNYSLNEKIQFFAQPVFRMHLNALDQRVFHLVSGGLEVGLRRKLN